jgi:hypothetical protein
MSSTRPGRDGVKSQMVTYSLVNASGQTGTASAATHGDSTRRHKE